MDRYGGRCVRRDVDSWEIYDVAQWTEEQAQILHRRFPSLAVRIHACRSSLSGFILVLTLQRCSYTWTSLLVCFVMIAIMSAVTFGITGKFNR